MSAETPLWPSSNVVNCSGKNRLKVDFNPSFSPTAIGLQGQASASTSYSDRFIPSRTSSRLDALDAGLVREASPRGAHGHANGSAASNIDNIQSHQSSSGGGGKLWGPLLGKIVRPSPSRWRPTARFLPRRHRPGLLMRAPAWPLRVRDLRARPNGCSRAGQLDRASVSPTC